MIYPVPDPSLPVPRRAPDAATSTASVSLGPSALLWPRGARELTWPGTWRMARALVAHRA